MRDQRPSHKRVDREFTNLSAATPLSSGELRNTLEAELLARDGWAMRAFACRDRQHIADHRTIGLRDNFSHPDLQIYYPVPPGMALDIFFTAVTLIKSGKQFVDGELSSDILEGFQVKFIALTVDRTAMLRMILPDKQGRLDRADIAHPYSLQYEETR